MTEFVKKRIIGYSCLALMLVLCLCALRPSAPNAEENQPPASSVSSAPSKPAKPDQVRLYTCDEELAAVLTQLAEEYSQQTGQMISVVTGSKDSCRASLEGMMESDDAPTLLCLHSREDLEYWESCLLDLRGNALLDKLANEAFALDMGGKKLAVTMDYEGYGLLYNAALLARVGFTRSDIEDYASLEVAVQYLMDRNLGFYAFAPANYENAEATGFTALLAQVLSQPEQLKRFLDLYIANDLDGNDGLQQFVNGNAVFYLGGTWEYEQVASLGLHQLDILPIYGGQEGGLQCIPKLCWGVNRNASSGSVAMTLDFLNWLVTKTEEAPAPLDRLGLRAPFLDATPAGNGLEKKMMTYVLEEPVGVSWTTAKTQAVLEALGQAMKAYAHEPSQENWDALAQLLN